MSMSVSQKAKLYNDANAALTSAKPSLDEVRRIFALLHRSANRLEVAGHKAEAEAMRAEATKLLSSSTVRTGSTVSARSAITISNNMLQTAKAISRIDKRLSRVERDVRQVERDVRHVVKGRSAHFDRRTGAMTRTPWPSYDEHVQATERHEMEIADLQNALGYTIDSVTGVVNYTLIEKSNRKIVFWPALIIALITLVIWFVISAWFNGATYAGWVIIGGGLVALISFILTNLNIFRNRS